jgi:hypothetical protein
VESVFFFSEKQLPKTPEKSFSLFVAQTARHGNEILCGILGGLLLHKDAYHAKQPLGLQARRG